MNYQASLTEKPGGKRNDRETMTVVTTQSIVERSRSARRILPQTSAGNSVRSLRCFAERDGK